MELERLKVQHPTDRKRFVFINAREFDPAVHALFVEEKSAQGAGAGAGGADAGEADTPKSTKAEDVKAQAPQATKAVKKK